MGIASHRAAWLCWTGTEGCRSREEPGAYPDWELRPADGVGAARRTHCPIPCPGSSEALRQDRRGRDCERERGSIHPHVTCNRDPSVFKDYYSAPDILSQNLKREETETRTRAPEPHTEPACPSRGLQQTDG